MNSRTTIKTISFSEASCYLRCGLQHKLRYIEKIESGFIDQALATGGCAHKSIENFLLKLKATDKLMNVIELQENFADALKYQAKEKKIRYKDGWNLERLIRQGKNMLSFWFQAFRKNQKGIIRIEVEKKFEVPLFDPETNDYSRFVVKGIIDAIFRTEPVIRNYRYNGEPDDIFLGSHKYCLIDWKTYLNTPNQVTLERCLQNAIYLWGADKAGYIPDRKSTACYMGVLHKKKTPIFQAYPTPITDNLIRQALKILNHVMLLKELDIAMPNYNQITCTTCNYYQIHCQQAY